MQNAVDTAYAPRGGLVRVSRDGSWFVTAEGETVSLEHRRNLRLLLGALILRRAQRPGEAMSVDDVFAQGWPGERVAVGAQNRVYVALSTLRKLGLRGVIERCREGYLIPPSASLVIEGS